MDTFVPTGASVALSPEQQAQAAQAVYEEVITDFRDCLKDYKSLTRDHWYGRFFDMDQVLKVGDMELATQNVQSRTNMDGSTECPANGKIKLVHAFQTSMYTIPIGGTFYRVYEIVPTGFFGYETLEKVTEGNLDKDGTKTIEQLKPGHQYKVVFYPDVTQKDLDILYQSYDELIESCVDWLRTESWETGQRQAWIDYYAAGSQIDLSQTLQQLCEGVKKAIKDIWDVLTKLFNILCDPVGNCKKLAAELKRITGAIVDTDTLTEKFKTAQDEVALTLTMLKDEALMFVCLNAAWSYFKLLTPQQIIDFVAQQLGSILTQFVIYLVLPAGIVSKIFDATMSVAG
ncbi:hypothetical protein [Metakosakonia massiliensis]|uniref:Rhs family protein n=1 Tax=Phytobacter massiliensis TaxID=1485952 RepID=A0A6N3ALP1_9ENTR|nr:hypothetical protein [Phytobacter massiliensis]